MSNTEPVSYISKKGYKRYLKPEGWHPPDPNKCQGWAAHSGKQCKRLRPDNKDYCYTHQPKNQSGTLNPNYKHGGYSQTIQRYIKQLGKMPEMLEAFQASLDDENQTDLTPAIAALDAVIMTKLETINFGELKTLGKLLTGVESKVKDISQAVNDYHTAASNKDSVAAGLAINEITNLSRACLSKIKASKQGLKMIGLEELEKSLERRARMASEKVKMETNLSQAVPPDVNMILINLTVASMHSAIMETVEDEQLRNKIFTKFHDEQNKLQG